jgi:hypothetical protein
VRRPTLNPPVVLGMLKQGWLHVEPSLAKPPGNVGIQRAKAPNQAQNTGMLTGTTIHTIIRRKK